MNDTKENILRTALRLFARDGYEAVPVSAIAGMLGMTKGALYRHYRNKREIFDRIVERVVEIDLACAKTNAVPEVTFDQDPAAYRHASLENIRNFSLSQFRFLTEDEFGRDFRKMITLEQYRDPEIADLHRKVFTAGPVSYIADLFREMMAQKIVKKSDPELLAIAFFAPFHLLVSMSDTPSDGGRALALLTAYIDDFIQKNQVEQNRDKEL